MIDNREGIFPKDVSLIKKITDRRFGIGADGLILIENHDQLDFKMIYFNSDGSQSLCGNGSRCAIKFADELSMVSGNLKFETTDGPHEGSVEANNIRFQLHDIKKIKQMEKDFFIDNGSPHFIRFVDDLSKVDVIKAGSALRHDARFGPDGTNVNFVEVKDKSLKIRTYERGVEDETLSCGTGVTASAIAASFLGHNSPIDLETRGGMLSVSFNMLTETHFTNVWLSGPATKTFEGEINLDSF